MKNNLTELVFILDRSGSMSGLESDTIGGFNSMIKKQKERDGEALVSTLLFDYETDLIHDRVPIKEVNQLTENEYFTRGCTALLDAVGGAVKHISMIHKYARPEDVPEKTIFVIITDGLENSSKHYTYADVKHSIEHEKEKYGWEFIFLGANIDAAAEADKIGIGADRSATYNCDKEGLAISYEAVSEVVSSVRSRANVSPNWSKNISDDFKRRK